MTVSCTQCGASLGERDVFCTKCGARRDGGGGPVPTQRFCNTCGAPFVGEGKFCTKCGATTSASSTPRVTAAPQVVSRATPTEAAVAPATVPAGKGRSPLLMIVLVIVGFVVLLGMAGVGGVIYVGYRAKKKVAEGQDPHQVARQLVAEAHESISARQYSTAVEKLKMAEILDPANSDVASILKAAQDKADEQPLRLGLEAYFQGKYDDAERQFGQYVDNHGRKVALAYFFRGASHASRYFLSGEKDAQQKELALADFRSSQKNAQQFQPPKDFVPPKILALYSQSVSIHSR